LKPNLPKRLWNRFWSLLPKASDAKEPLLPPEEEPVKIDLALPLTTLASS
jgi:hypothetical protein